VKFRSGASAIGTGAYFALKANLDSTIELAEAAFTKPNASQHRSLRQALSLFPQRGHAADDFGITKGAARLDDEPQS
jgi:hypothetical protein